MPAEKRQSHQPDLPCTCGMRHLYRFVEPVLLFMLKTKGTSYGYDLAGDLGRYALTDAPIEKAVLYRTLRHLENHGFVVSNWSMQASGPARRVYSLTGDGERHLEEWAGVLDDLARAMNRFVGRVHSTQEGAQPADLETTAAR
jgi:PadR family transcriptional regulator, regulatory protein PadR